MMSQALLYLSRMMEKLLLLDLLISIPLKLMRAIPESSDGTVPNGLNLVLTLMEMVVVVVCQVFPYLSRMMAILSLLEILLTMAAIPEF